MKNAYVLVHHHGDDGTVTEGMILAGISNNRFEALEKRGLVREATAAEVKKGFQPAFEKDEAEGPEVDETDEKAKPATPNKSAAKPANKSAPPAPTK